MITTVTSNDCRDVAPLLAGLAEDGAPAPDVRVTRHLAECAACRRQLQVQRDVHGLLRARASTLQGRAPEALRARLEATATRVPWTRRMTPLRMPVAATVTLAMVGTLLYGATSASSTVLAAQLALDHLKCIRLFAGRPLNADQAARDWSARYGWTPRLPRAMRSGATMVGARRCLYGHGYVAHFLYEIDGRVVSLFVMPRHEYRTGEVPASRVFLGQRATVWANSDQSFAVVGALTAERLEALADEFRTAEERGVPRTPAPGR